MEESPSRSLESKGITFQQACHQIKDWRYCTPILIIRRAKFIDYNKKGTISNATTFKILIIGLIAGPAVSL